MIRLLLFKLLFLPIYLLGQVEYTPFDFEHSIWQESSYHNEWLRSFYEVSISGDTLIEGQIFSKLQKTGISYH